MKKIIIKDDIDASNRVDRIRYAYTNCDRRWDVIEQYDLNMIEVNHCLIRESVMFS